ncbi:MAG: hypothetical protein ABJA70_20090 [Chryseolinea sp.]
MTTNNTFSFQRLTLLLKQNFFHHYKLFGIYIAAFAGGVFILHLLIQMAEEFRDQPIGKFFEIFVGLFIAVSVLATGTAFPNLRTKEKALAYLLLPASTLEKLIVEWIVRVLFLIILVPILYWAVYGIENFMISAINPDYHVTGDIRYEIPNGPSHEEGMRGWWYTFSISLTSTMFILPFTGSTVFVKNPLIKTLFALAIFVVFHVFLAYFFIEILNFKDLSPNKKILFISTAESALITATFASVIFNVGLLTASFFKLKEREV